MITAVDTSVLINIYKGEKESARWFDLLVGQAQRGVLTICDVVLAEFHACILDKEETKKVLTDLGIVFSPITVEASLLAGEIFSHYRKHGGPRQLLIPDFIIGAHAKVQTDALISLDRGYFRKYFNNLKILSL